MSVAIREGRIMSDALEEPYCALSPMIVAGNSCMLVAFMTMKSIMLSVAFSEPSCIHSMAFIPRGVAALPIPSRFAEKFSVIYCLVSSLSPLNSRLVTGENSLSSARFMPIFCIMSSTDSHIAYMAHSLTAREIAPLAPLIIIENALSGDTIVTSIREDTVMIKNIVFILVPFRFYLTFPADIREKTEDIRRDDVGGAYICGRRRISFYFLYLPRYNGKDKIKEVRNERKVLHHDRDSIYFG